MRADQFDAEEREEERSFIKQLEVPLLISVLKEKTDRQNPLSAHALSEELSEMTGLFHSEKTVLRKLQALINLQEKLKGTELEERLMLSLGGILHRSYNTDTTIRRVQTRFFFVPLLTDADAELISGAITSNRYLTEAEKDYLSLRIENLSPGEPLRRVKGTIKQNKGMAGSVSARVLLAVNRLHAAIQNKQQVDVVYGAYNEKGFYAKNPDRPYHLNPYVMLWNDGEYYLLATHAGHDNVSHFRVDRIVSVTIITDRKRDVIPESLRPYYQFHRGGLEEFDSEKYTSVYPTMGIYGDTDLIRAVIECKKQALGVVVDYFGTDLRVVEPQLEHDEFEVDQNGRPQEYVGVHLPQAQYENVRAFCLLQQEIVMAVRPERLRKDVEEHFLRAAEKYQSIRTKN